MDTRVVTEAQVKAVELLKKEVSRLDRSDTVRLMRVNKRYYKLYKQVSRASVPQQESFMIKSFYNLDKQDTKWIFTVSNCDGILDKPGTDIMEFRIDITRAGASEAVISATGSLPNGGMNLEEAKEFLDLITGISKEHLTYLRSHKAHCNCSTHNV